MQSRTFALAALLLASQVSAGTRKLTIDDIYDPKNRIQFSGAPQSGFVWIDDTHFFFPRTKGMEVTAEVLVDATTGKEVAFFDVDDLQGQVGKVKGVSDDEAKKLARPRSVELNAQHTAVLLTIADDLYSYEMASKKLTRLTDHEGEEELAAFSPDGKQVAFVRNNDLFVVDAAGGLHETKLSSGGGDRLFNGKFDWVYQEEVYGRGIFKGYWWSPDSKSIAYLQLDETPVKPFTIVDHIPYEQHVEQENYPKAGAPNPIAKLFAVDVASGTTVEMSRRGYEDVQPLIVDVSWTPDSKRVVYQIQDREQTWLDLLTADRTDGNATKLLRETTEAWVEPQGSPKFLRDGSFLWLSERSGFKHLYRVSADGRTQTQLTRGEWEVRTLHGVDEKRGFIYFSGTADSPIAEDVYRVKIDGSGRTRLSPAGWNAATFNPSLTMFVDQMSDVTTPPHTSLFDASGKVVRVIDANPVSALGEYALVQPEFRQVKTRDGFVMEAMLIRPATFDATKKYPVYEYTYSGPHTQSVKNQWGGATYMFHQLLAQHGIAVWICDNRTASGKGARSAWPAYKNFGELELRDLEDGAAWMKSQPWVDGSKIVLSGWSFGGFMTSYAMTHPSSFAAGIAGGSVTDWRDYDSIYTERYMLTPEHNKEGYERTAPRKAAKDMHGRLLLLHGTIDDNVHMQNTVQFTYDLEKAGKQFELMVYPKSRHGVTDPLLVKHMRTLMLGFIERVLSVEQK